MMEHFIETVKKYPCLWQTTAVEYKDQELKDAAWNAVLKETTMSSVKEAKSKWKKLRDSYRDALKRQNDPANNSVKSKYPWKYQSLMQFLQPYMGNRQQKKAPSKTLTSLQDNVQIKTEPGTSQSTDNSDSESTYSPKKRKYNQLHLNLIDRKLDYLCKQKCRQDMNLLHAAAANDERRRELAALPDPLDIFFNSMCQSTKRLPFTTQLKIKRLLFAAVTESEEALAQEQQNYANVWANDAASSSSHTTTQFLDDDIDQKDPSYVIQ